MTAVNFRTSKRLISKRVKHAELTSDRKRRGSDTTGQRTTAASSADGSSSPRNHGRWSLRCWSAGRGPPSRCRLLQTATGDTDQHWAGTSLPANGTSFHLLGQQILRVLPRRRRTRSTAGWQRGRRCARTRRCCCTRPRTRSPGNTPGERQGLFRWFSFRCKTQIFPKRFPVVPTLPVPAGGMRGRTRSVLRLRTPPGCPSSSCCCSSSPAGDGDAQKQTNKQDHENQSASLVLEDSVLQII